MKLKKSFLELDKSQKNLRKEDEEHLKQRAENADYWLEKFAPEDVKFEVKEKLPKISIDEKQKEFLSSLSEKMSPINWEAEAIHNAIYDTSESVKIPIKTAFESIYKIILGKDKGPRAGYFLSNLDKDFVLKRVKEAVK